MNEEKSERYFKEWDLFEEHIKRYIKANDLMPISVASVCSKFIVEAALKQKNPKKAMGEVIRIMNEAVEKLEAAHEK
jgi:hypothetical protein